MRFDPPAPQPGDRLCAFDDLADPGAKELDYREGQTWFSMFVVRRGAAAFAYVNLCPHAGRPLNYGPDAFLTPDRTHLMCAAHGAVFRIEDGACVAGPCLGKTLATFPVEVKDGAVYAASN